MEQISASEKVRKLTYWVSRLSEDPKKLRQNVVERLVGKNVLLEEEKHFFRQPPMTGSEISALNKFQLKYLLRSITLSNGESDPRSLALLNLAVAGDLLGLIFTQDEIEIAYRMIHKQVMEAAMENQVMQFIEEIELAVSSVLENETE
jgi:hypothetical protein